MNIIDRLIFAATQQGVGNTPIDSTYSTITGLSSLQQAPTSGSHGYYYNRHIQDLFCTLEDTEIIERSIQRHWFDVVNNRQYSIPPNSSISVVYDDSFTLPPYHLMYAYLLENTRIAQIFEKLIYLYQTDEKLTKSSDRSSFQWIMNTDALFFKDPPSSAIRFYNGYLRPVPEGVRRNVYHRLFGLDLAFGDITNNPPKYVKGEFNNSTFILLFESFLREFWQAYTNARNTSGQNFTDYFSLTDTAEKLQELLMSRRSMNNNFNHYKYFNLSREEYSSVLMMSWLFNAVSYNSPLVEYLRCTGNTPGERLINIGLKVGIPAHSKSELIFEMAPALATLLRMIEHGDYNPAKTANVTAIVMALVPPFGTPTQIQTLNSILLIINNWERVTGHRIKTMETPVVGNVRVVSTLPLVKQRV
jgi:hypothetical protein